MKIIHVSLSYLTAQRNALPDSLNSLLPSETASIHELNESRNYFCITSQTPLSLPNEKHPESDVYAMVEITFDSLPIYYLVFSEQWLAKELNEPVQKIQETLPKILLQWKGSTRLSLKHEGYQKDQKQYTLTNLLTKATSYELLYRFLSDLSLELLGDRKQKYRSKELENVRNIVNDAFQNIHQSTPTISEMAAKVGISSTKFKLLFKEVFGMSPRQYILEKKLEYARQLVQTGEYTFTQISYMIGYNHASGFTRMYNKRFKETQNVSMYR